jgi:glycosyltransferase involved in cell wall biosynthesis
MNPAVSIIIPTTNRPQYLPRAIDSALTGMNPEDIEVIVVPNGPDNSWRKSLSPYQNNHSLRIFPIKQANANIARNAGLDIARGDFVRFLDDDDYLIPDGAIKQYDLIKTSGADVVSGRVQLVDERGRCFDTWHHPDMDDFCAAVLGPWRNCLLNAHVYRRERLGNARWNPETFVRQDFEWLFDLCVSHELKWIKFNEVVGVWQHHWGQQISSSKSFNEIRKLTVPMLMRAHDRLLASGRLYDIRQKAIAQGIWSCVHTAFFLEPLYWHRIAYKAQEINSTSRPAQALYNYPVLKNLNPLIIMWLMFPVKCLMHQIRQILKKLHIRHTW